MLRSKWSSDRVRQYKNKNKNKNRYVAFWMVVGSGMDICAILLSFLLRLILIHLVCARRRHGHQRAGLVDGMAPAAESRVPNLRDGGEDDAHMTRLPL